MIIIITIIIIFLFGDFTPNPAIISIYSRPSAFLVLRSPQSRADGSIPSLKNVLKEEAEIQFNPQLGFSLFEVASLKDNA